MVFGTYHNFLFFFYTKGTLHSVQQWVFMIFWIFMIQKIWKPDQDSGKTSDPTRSGSETLIKMKHFLNRKPPEAKNATSKSSVFIFFDINTCDISFLFFFFLRGSIHFYHLKWFGIDKKRLQIWNKFPPLPVLAEVGNWNKSALQSSQNCEMEVDWNYLYSFGVRP